MSLQFKDLHSNQEGEKSSQTQKSMDIQIMQFKHTHRSEKESAQEFALSALIYKHKSCEKCFKKHNEASMVLCDRCEDAFHIRCINLSEVPRDTWICATCQIDVVQLKQVQLMRKRPVGTNSMDECRKCKHRTKQTFQFQYGEEKILFEAKDISLVRCAYCEQQFHNLCFSERPNSINCQACEDLIREAIPKGHENFITFMRQSRAKVAERNYHELTSDFHCPQSADHCLPPQQLVPPKQIRDWRLLVSYQASLCYALFTRDMIYCQNLVIEMAKEKIENVIRSHKNSVEKIYRLHRSDEIAYELFKSRLELGFMPPIEVREDRKKGFYLISTSFIPVSTILAQYAGELITARESLNMITNDNIFTLIRNPRSSESLDIGPNQFANIAIFISGVNNSEKDAASRENVRALKFSYRGVIRLIFTALKDIYPKQTLYLNYNGDRAISEYPTNDFVH